ncbi:MAG: long-chain fatty acid--CoA ligase [Ruminococcaceae bacterium]|nr:long-chain fatty acid--CoA ligase [Oscillospiraceae bacterium]
MSKIRENMPRTLRELLADVTVSFGTKTAFREKKDGVYQDVSYARFGEEVKALSLMLEGHFAPGDRVVLLGKNSYRWVLSFMALTVLGVIPVPVDAAVRPKDLAAIAAEAEIEGILYDAELRGKRRVLTGVTAICFDKYPYLLAEGKHKMNAADYNLHDFEADTDDLAALFFTPGTTGSPKGVMLSHRNLLASIGNICQMIDLDGEDVFLSVLPLSHTYECVCGFLLPLYHGATVAFGEGLAHLLRNMREIHPTFMVTIPFIAEALYRKCWQKIERGGRETRVRRFIAVSDPVRPLSVRQAMKERLLATDRAFFGGALRRLLVLGEPMDAAVQKGLRQLGVFTMQGYGMTECAALAAMDRDDSYRDGSAGLAFPDTMLDIYNAQPDGSGEIRYKGDNVMLGYLGDPARTEKALDGGWYYTGDIGRIDKDGFLFILGRRQNCIETAGHRLICPEFLERMLCQSPFVKEAVVVGTLNPETKDSEPAAMILPDLDYTVEVLGENCTEEELEKAIDEWIAELNGELDLYQQISFYVLCEQPFPKDGAGRVRRAEMAKVFQRLMSQSKKEM